MFFSRYFLVQKLRLTVMFFLAVGFTAHASGVNLSDDHRIGKDRAPRWGTRSQELGSSCGAWRCRPETRLFRLNRTAEKGQY